MVSSSSMEATMPKPGCDLSNSPDGFLQMRNILQSRNLATAVKSRHRRQFGDGFSLFARLVAKTAPWGTRDQ